MGKYNRKYVGETTEHLFDEETGEILERKVRVWSYQKPVDKGFVKFFDAFVKELLLDEDISKGAIRLLFYIASILDYDDEIFYLSPTEVAEELNVHRVTIQKWLKTLLNKRLILKTNRRNWYMVNRHCLYRGSVARADIEEFNEGLDKLKKYYRGKKKWKI